MKKLYKFLLKELIFYIFLFICGVILVYIVVDFFEDIDKFFKKDVNPFYIILFYLYQVPYLFVLLLPVATLLAPFFAIGRMARDFELIAIKTSGIHIRKFFLPLIFLGFFLSMISFAVNETIKPYFMRKSEEIRYTHIEKRTPPWKRIFEVNFNFVEKEKNYERLFHFGRIDSRLNEGRDIYIVELVRGKNRKIIYAKKGEFVRNIWVLKQGYLYIFDDNGEVKEYEVFKEKKFSEFKVSPIKMLAAKKRVEEMNIFELKKLVNLLKKSGRKAIREEVEFYVHFSFPFSVFITLILSVSLASLTRQRGKAFTLTLASVLSFIYWGLLEISKAMGVAGILPPFLAAWLPNLIFLFPSLFFYFFIPP
jgi:LPS export ABC transporter permease LptG